MASDPTLEAIQAAYESAVIGSRLPTIGFCSGALLNSTLQTDKYDPAKTYQVVAGGEITEVE